DGNLTRLTGLDLDFNKQRYAEETQQLLRDEEHNRVLRTLLETATQGIVSVDAQGAIVSANRAFEMMFGWSPDELLGQSIARLIPSAFGEGLDSRGVLECIGIRKDSSTFPIEVSVNHVSTPEGRRAFGFVSDITERQRAASALQERTAELEYRTRR